MAFRTLAQLREEVRQRADMEDDDQVVTDDELNRFINQSIKEWYDLLIESADQEFFAVSAILNLTGVDYYLLPPDFYRLLGVDYAPSFGSRWQPVGSFRFQDRLRYDGVQVLAGPKYRLAGNTIVFVPTSTTGLARVWYIPQTTELTADTDTFDGMNGWEEYVVVDAAIKCLEKEQTDSSELRARKAEIKSRVQSLAAKRDAGGVETIVDVYKSSNAWHDE